MSWGAIGAAGIGAVVNMSNAAKNRRDAKEAARMAMVEKERQQLLLDQQKNQYRNQSFSNPFAGMENVYEDLTVNQQAAQFQTQQGAQQRANIMGTLKETAGPSGIASLAQTLANQGALQTQRISAQIGQQEAVNQRLTAKGAGQVQAYERQGDQWVQQSKMDREATLLGMQMGQSTGANKAAIQAQANQLNAQLAQQQVTADMFGTATTALAANADEIGGVDNKFWTNI